MSTCEKCHHGHPIPEVPGSMSCMRFPPALFVLNQNVMTQFPAVRPNWHCGEWKKREVTKKKGAA